MMDEGIAAIDCSQQQRHYHDHCGDDDDVRARSASKEMRTKDKEQEGKEQEGKEQEGKEQQEDESLLKEMKGLGLPTKFTAKEFTTHSSSAWFREEIEQVKRFSRAARNDKGVNIVVGDFMEALDPENNELYYPCKILEEIWDAEDEELWGFRIWFLGDTQQKNAATTVVPSTHIRALGDSFIEYVQQYLAQTDISAEPAHSEDQLAHWHAQHIRKDYFDMSGGTPSTDSNLSSPKTTNSSTKYWNRRFTLWSQFHHGIRMDTESWYSVTPEIIAIHIAERCPPKKPVIDAFAGVGGNAIQFAKAGLDVTAIEIDATKCAMLKHNASIYGVEHSIDIICGNCLEWITENEEWINQSEATIFLAPPWGGPNYSMKQKFSVRDDLTIDGLNGFDILKLALRLSKRVLYFLPRNSDIKELHDELSNSLELRIIYSDGKSNPDVDPRGDRCASMSYVAVGSKIAALLLDVLME